MHEEAEDNRKRLSDVLDLWYNVSVEPETLKMTYFVRDMTKEPIIDKIRKEVTFETEE